MTDQSRPDVPVEPVTEAGRRLLAAADNIGERGFTSRGDYLRDLVLAIEAEARTPAADAPCCYATHDEREPHPRATDD